MLPMITRRNYQPFSWTNLFEDDFFPVLSTRKEQAPAVNIREDEKQIVLDLAIPGANKKDLKVELNEDVLTISSENKNENEEKKDGFMRKEFSYMSFTRSFYIPENINKEKIAANYKDGILTVELPKEEAKASIAKEVKIS